MNNEQVAARAQIVVRELILSQLTKKAVIAMEDSVKKIDEGFSEWIEFRNEIKKTTIYQEDIEEFFKGLSQNKRLYALAVAQKYINGLENHFQEFENYMRKFLDNMESLHAIIDQREQQENNENSVKKSA